MSHAGALLFTAIIYIGFEFYNYLVIPLCGTLQPRRIPDRAPRLQQLSFTDKLFITFSRLITALFVWHCYQFAVSEVGRVRLDVDSKSLLTAVVALPIQLPMAFVVYDFFYTLFHWALHWEAIYPFIHKHHHRQMSPFRGNTDAINVHPFEYVVGEYNHLWTIFLLTRIFGPQSVHFLTLVVFIILGGALASLNHTRYDIQLPYVFNVRAHDFHHRQPKCNFGQYLMLWDCVFGTFMPCESRATDADAALASAAVKSPVTSGSGKAKSL